MLQNKNHFDERQLKIRGDVFQQGFILLIALLFINSYLTDMGIIWAEGMWSGILIPLFAVTFCSIELILRGVYQANGKTQVATWLLGALSIAMLGFAIFDLFSGNGFVTDGHLTKNGVYFVMDLMFVANFATFLFKKMWAKRNVEED
jgi:hypothetical protein